MVEESADGSVTPFRPRSDVPRYGQPLPSVRPEVRLFRWPLYFEEDLTLGGFMRAVNGSDLLERDVAEIERRLRLYRENAPKRIAEEMRVHVNTVCCTNLGRHPVQAKLGRG